MEEKLNEVNAKPKYTMKVARDGRRSYYKNGQMTRGVNVPKQELVRLQREFEAPEMVDQPILDTATVVEEPPVCLMCGEPATRTRYANNQILHVCEEHYFKSTLGSLVIKLREVKQYEPVLSNQQTIGS